MLVVSNIDLTANLPVMKPATFLESAVKDFTLNINNDYRYLKTGYYVSLHAEVLGNNVIPPSENVIDAYRTPILLLRASKAGIPTVPYIVTGSVKQIMAHFSFPLVVFAVNPFSFDGYRIVKNRSALYRAVKSLGMNYKFDVCAQPLMGEILSFKSIFGKSPLEEAKRISEEVYKTFKIPICKLHFQRTEKGIYLCGLQPLRREEISAEDMKTISEVCQLLKNGDPFIV